MQTALHDWHLAHRGRMVDFAGWQMPVQFSSIVDEHHAVRRRAGLFDIAHMGRLWFSGPDAVRFLDFLLTNDVSGMSPGQVRYALVCKTDGGILDDVLVYRFEQECLLVVNASNRRKILSWVEEHLPEFDVRCTDRTMETCMMALQGPRSEAVLQPETSCRLSEMRYYSAARGRICDVEGLVSRTGYTGEDGFEVIVPTEAAVMVWERLLKVGEPQELVPCGLGCRDTLRLEAGMPLYGHEMDESVDPLTAGLSFGVKLSKEKFLGRAALGDLAARGDRPKRVGLHLSGRRIAREHAELWHGGKRVGHVTSGTFSPTLGFPIAMGYLPNELAAAGTAVEVDIRGQREPATVVKLPFYKR